MRSSAGRPAACTAEEGEEGEQQPQDTTKKERKIRKPLESYFFSDSVRSLNNFRWNVRRDYNRVEIGPLDTTLTDWRIDYPFYREEVGDIAQGARTIWRTCPSTIRRSRSSA